MSLSIKKQPTKFTFALRDFSSLSLYKKEKEQERDTVHAQGKQKGPNRENQLQELSFPNKKKSRGLWNTVTFHSAALPKLQYATSEADRLPVTSLSGQPTVNPWRRQLRSSHQLAPEVLEHACHSLNYPYSTFQPLLGQHLNLKNASQANISTNSIIGVAAVCIYYI